MTDLSTVGGRLEFARSQKGLLQKDLAKLLGMKNTTQISQWESDVYTPNAQRLAQLADALNVDPRWILSGNGNAPIGSTANTGDRMAWERVVNTEPVEEWLDSYRVQLRRAGVSADDRDRAVREIRRAGLGYAVGGSLQDWTVEEALSLMDAVGRSVLEIAKGFRKSDDD